MSTIETWDTAMDDALANQPLQQTIACGGTGGGVYCAMAAHFIQFLTFYSAQDTSKKDSFGNDMVALIGLGIGFDNGRSVNLGTTNGNGVTLDLTGDSIARLYFMTVNDTTYFTSSGVSGVYVETTRGKTHCSSPNLQTPLQNPKAWVLATDAESKQPVTNIVPIGVAGKAGTYIDSLSFYYKQDRLVTQAMTDVVYTNWVCSSGTTINVATATVSNQTDQVQQMSISFQESATSSYTYSVSAGVTVGAETQIEAGIPFVVDGVVKVSASVTFSAAFGYAKSVSDAFSYTATVSVPQMQTIIASADAKSYTINGSFTAKLSEIWAHAGTYTRAISGTISGISSYDVTVTYTSG